MNKNLTTIETNTKVALNRTKSLLSLKNKLITKDKKDISSPIISYNQNKIIEFEDNIEAWIDTESGLMWEVKNKLNADLLYVKNKEFIGYEYMNEKLNYQDAESYINYLNSIKYGGYDDWRMPNLKELNTLYFEHPFNKNFNNLYDGIDYPLKPNGSNFYIKAPLLKNTQNWYWALEIHPLNDYSDFIHFDFCGAGSTYHTPAKALRCVRGKLKIKRKEIKTKSSNIEFVNNLFDWANENELEEIHKQEVINGKSYLKGFPYTEYELLNINELNIEPNSCPAYNYIVIISEEIGKLKQLKVIDFTGNLINKLPKEIGNLSNLTQLFFGVNQITEIPKEIGNLTRLTILSLSSNILSTLPNEIVNLDNLTNLDLTNNPNLILTTEQKEWIKELKNNGCHVSMDDDLLNRVDKPKIEINEDEILF